MPKRIEKLCQLRVGAIEKPTLDEELRWYDAESSVKLLQSERSLNAIQLETWNEQVRRTTQMLQQARERSAAEALASAAETESEVPALLRPVAEKSRLLAERNRALTRKIQEAKLRQSRVHVRLDELKDKLVRTQTKVKSVGLPASVGAMLRNQRTGLPDVRSLRSSVHARSKLVEDVQLEMFDLDDTNKRLVNVESESERVVGQLLAARTNQAGNPPLPAGDLKKFTTPEYVSIASELLESRMKVVDALNSSLKTLFDSLTDTSIAEEELILKSEEFRNFIDERVLWVRSHPSMMSPPSGEEIKTETNSLRVWQQAPFLLPKILVDATRQKLTYFTYGLFAAILFFARPVFGLRLRKIAEMVRGSAYRHFYPSLTALLLNALSCLLIPSLLAFFGWRLGKLDGPNPLAGFLGHALQIAAMVTLPLSFYSRVFAKNGLADAHFDWSQSTAVLMRANIRWVSFALVPLVILGTTLYQLQAVTSPGIAHRVIFIAACITVTFLFWRVLHPSRGLPKVFLERHAGGWLDRLQVIWFWGLLTIPVSLATLAFLGYSYTAHELAWRGFASIAIAGLFWILHGLSMRLLLVHRRRLAVERARMRYAEYQRQRDEDLARAAAMAATQAHQANQPIQEATKTNATTGERPATVKKEARIIANLPGVSVTSAGLVMGEDPLAELRANTEQSRRLVTSLLIGAAVLMMWMTWHNVLPALGFLENWPLWNSSHEVAETVINDAGIKQIRTREVTDPVTITDLFLAVIIAIVSFVAARDLPGLLELLVLEKLPLEKSVRYAITTVSSYIAFVIGFLIAFRFVGLRWHQVQWMATALTFGLAFGLQEMFANFVAGIIILFERPIRVGDIVTIDDVTGIVSRVRMRATTVTNFDRKDYVVPNKDFITGRLLNWTLSDHVNRITIEVGVAYGTDTELAKTLLVQIADAHPLVESDPPAMATFEGFDSSSLKVVMRCFIAMSNMPMRLEVVDQLHTSIDASFKAAAIEIAFPQQDINVRQVPASLKVA